MAAVLEFLASEYVIHLAILVCMYIILAQGLNLTFGLGRLFNLAHVASFAIGAYATALLSVEAEAGFLVCVLASMLEDAPYSVRI
jgi:branched-chain amino acid transport system permease protein